MAVITPRDLENGKTLEADICICGSGPAGISLAHALEGSGRSVCIVESGIDKPNEEIQHLNDLENVGFPLRPHFVNRLRMIGGTSNLWPGRCVRLDPIDFERRPWVPFSGWPLAYAEYTAYMRRAAPLLRLPEPCPESPLADGGSPSHIPGPEAWDAAGLDATEGLWAKAPARFWPIFRKRLTRSSGVTLIADLTLTGLDFSDDGGHVTSLETRDRSGRRFTVRAGQYILAMGGLENTRTLLLAAERNAQARIPRAPLGKYYMDHPKTTCGRIELAEGVDWRRLVGRHAVPGGRRQLLFRLSPETQRREGLLNAYVNLEPSYSGGTEANYNRTIEILKRLLRKGHVGNRLDLSEMEGMRDLIYQLTPDEIVPYPVYRLLQFVKQHLKKPPRHLVIVNHCEQIPNENSKISLSDQRDRFDNPRIRLHWEVVPAEIETLARLQTHLADFLEQNGIGKLVTDVSELSGSHYTDASHHMGGTRMSADRETGVVDEHLAVHGVDNLHVLGSSVFPTGGAANPTWSIVALALRLADRLTDST
ncbi:GMC oxidoreductase [Pseudodesulfovibrio mercurii]|uniref:GMC oxidoreductase n=1 Tax=Pseudodesulfovibrio mercurii TaxID=641491 RepID=F0JID1_9BACT|nr:GMC family oxidoreductase [Pseudodesulfovibrio mercurii]EGB14183.1 GMC oxidoreductase [Pseudodesulfovibrio mercurii]